MNKTFIAFGVFRLLFFGKHILQFSRSGKRINHHIFCRTRMHILSLNFYLNTCGIKVFVFEFTQGAAVYGIGKVRPEFFYIKKIGTSSDFFIGSKTDFYFAVFNFGMSQKIFYSAHDNCNTGLIVCTQEGCSVGCNNLLTFKLF